jgi:lysozyme
VRRIEPQGATGGLVARVRGLSIERRSNPQDGVALDRDPTPPKPAPPDPPAPPARPVKSRRRRRFRRIRIALTILIVLAIAATAGFYEVFEPYYRPKLQAGETYGVDVSNYQGTIDWSQVAQHRVRFAYLKATEGNDFVDKQFATNWAGTAKAGIPHGAYHFFTLCSSGAEQAANFLKVVPKDPKALPPVVDVEFSTCTKRPSAAEVSRQLGDFMSTVEQQLHTQMIVYTVPSFTAVYPIDKGESRGQWTRRIFRRPGGDWTIWQASDQARIGGITGRVDLDVRRS